ncbi:DEAD/DEAH box helicase [Streptomyces tropicalis]|uniref:RNA helicase n=1 Tax=Streptomyces tropicalis TaxID=3034234 RepID=A0ABT6A2K0_9ACTN|nr:DEAD/DEAH box helicase [Streptomyces tropicalis]MDF3298025.1 DEAD/DEAH box helicase [Streptomyces tropicalis]
MTLPVALSGSDVIGQAKTGTGKTLGFGLPLLERVTVPADVESGRARPEDLTDAPQALVVVPTRELCVQVTNDLLTAGKVRNVRVTAIYGGRAYEPQVETLKKGVDVVVGTPGRLLDLAGQKKLNLKHVKCLVLDEADEMLDLGFLPDVEKIVAMLPARRQTMLFSATMPGAVIGLARRYMSQPTHIRATAPDDQGATVANIKQFVYRAHSMDKPEMVARMLQADGRGLAMIFCRTKRTAADIAEQLQRRGFASGAVHGDLGQGAREQALRAFRNGKVDVLVCTDVAARGIDVEGVTHVVNYQSPEDEKTYLHRIGRTGRAGAKGTAITLVDWDDIPRWQLINKALELEFSDPPETYSTSPHLFTDLGIPEGTKGVLPRSERTRAGLDAEEVEDLGETGGRGERGRGGRGGRGDSRPAEREGERSERSERTPRRRRRTRNGAPVSATAPVDVAPQTPGGPDAADESSAPRTPRRRRRTRGGAAAQVTSPETGAAAGETVAVAAAVEPAPTAQAAVATAEGPALDTPEPAARPRRRSRKAAEPVETADTLSAEAAEPTAPRARRRTRTAAEPAGDAPAAEAAVATAEGAEATAESTPRRTRKKAVAAPAAEAPETAEQAEAAPRRRSRKTAATAEAALDTAEAAEAKPRRTRKKAVAAEAPDAEAGPTTEAAPRRRTRKATATAEAALDTAEAAEATPRRTRKKAVAAEAPDAEAGPTTEAAPRRRTRKTAATAEAATADIPAQSSAEPEAAPRRRTRKAAEAAAGEPAEAKAPARRSRKAAAAVETEA